MNIEHAGSDRFPCHSMQVLDTAYLLVGSLCGLIAALGYYMYGSNVAEVIIFSLPAGALALVCSCLVMINPITKYALTLEPVCAAVTGSGIAGFLPGGLRKFSLRTALAIGTLFSAMYVPYLAVVMSLIGSVLTVSISVLLPAVLHLVLVHGSSKPNATKFSKAWDYFCVAAGIVCAVSGTTAALKGLAAQIAASAAMTV